MSKSSKKSTSRNKKNAPHKPRKTRGTLLTIALIFMVLHGLAAFVYYAVARTDTSIVSRPWLVGLMSLHFLLNVVAAVGIWFWQKWALYVYAGSTILAVVVGLLTIGIWSTFYMVMPFVIIGWLLRTKWSYFQ
jgi:hypothetical protein